MINEDGLTDFDTLIPNIISRKLAGCELTDSENDALNQWLDKSEANKVLYGRICSGESMEEYDRLKQRVSSRDMTRRIERKRNNLYLRRIAISISGAAAVLAIGMLLLKNISNSRKDDAVNEVLMYSGRSMAILTIGSESVELKQDDSEDKWQEYAAQINQTQPSESKAMTIKVDIPRGGEYKLRLPDGTQVWLNAETTIEYPEVFSDDVRNVKLSGEAYFDVTHNPKQPFVITTNDGVEVTVLGTEFNISNYTTDDQTVVTLVEGTVKVANQTNSETITPNTQAIFNRQSGEFSVAKVSNMKPYVAWTEGQFYYKDAMLDEIFDALGRWYDVRFDYQPDNIKSIGETTLIFNRSDNLCSVLEALHTLTGLNYEVVGKTIKMTL